MRQRLIIGIVVFFVIDLVLLALLLLPEINANYPIQITHIPLKPEEAIVETEPSKAVKSVNLVKREQLKAGRSVKSVLFSPDRKYLYTLNLEGGSVYEFDRATRKLNRKLIFKQTAAKGYDYEKHAWIANSFEEKPVEGHFTHGGKYLWISLHNAEGVVAWNVQGNELITGKPFRIATIEHGKKKVKTNLHFFQTGRTPKVITSTKHGKYLFVSNWHSHTVSVLDISSADPNNWKKVKDISVRPTPRGMCLSQDDKTLYVGLMGSDFLYAVGIDSLKVLKKYTVGNNPRHLLNTGESMYISLSRTEKLLKINQDNLTIQKRSNTQDDPRTIGISPDQSMIFTTCYSDNVIQIFDAQHLNVLASIESKGKPVGLDVFQQENRVEVWVGNYTASTVNVFTFDVEYESTESQPKLANAHLLK